MFAIQDFIKSARGGTLAVTAALLFVASAYAQSDPLPSWNDTASKAAIVSFVDKVTGQGSPEFVRNRNASPFSIMMEPCGSNIRSIRSSHSLSTE